MKARTTKQTTKPPAPVFPQTLHETRPNQEKVLPHPKPKKGNKTSRDLREDRGTREMKTSHNDQTNHAR